MPRARLLKNHRLTCRCPGRCRRLPRRRPQPPHEVEQRDEHRRHRRHRDVSRVLADRVHAPPAHGKQVEEVAGREDDLEREQYLRQHIQALSDRIKELSSKNYFELPGLKSPEMVFMFVPIESAFVEAIRNDEKLFQMAIEQQVLVTTPTTLLTSLNVVRQLWRFEDQNKHSAQLADQAGKVYNQLRLFLESLEALGVQLDKSRKLYDEAMNRFISGKGNLVKRVEDFQKLGVSVKKEMPAELLQKAGLELDLIESPQDSKDS